MAKSAKKRQAACKPLSRKSQVKFKKRMQTNNEILSKLEAK